MGDNRLKCPGELKILLLFSGELFRPMESDSVAEFEPVSSTLRLALSAISAKKKKERRNYHLSFSSVHFLMEFGANLPFSLTNRLENLGSQEMKWFFI